ncbi:MAG: response regulator [Firmicutes bacterium]|nr:response regulator [Bacillota bacterium]
MNHTPVKVLIVDDNPSSCSILRDYFLSVTNISLCGIVFNGAEALEMIQLHKPDVILLDIIMPEMDGLSVLEYLKNNKEDFSSHKPSVIVISALNSEAITRKVLQLGASYYLIKPYPLEQLSDRIQMLTAVDHTFSGLTETIPDLSGLISRHLIEAGIPTHIVGYRYCVQAIEMLVTHPNYCPLMKCVYPVIAERNNTTVSCVESAIRKAIASIKDEELNRLSNRTFLSRLSEQIRVKYQIILPHTFETRYHHD